MSPWPSGDGVAPRAEAAVGGDGRDTTSPRTCASPGRVHAPGLYLQNEHDAGRQADQKVGAVLPHGAVVDGADLEAQVVIL